MDNSLRIAAWKTFAYWSVWVGIAFFAVYPTCNWLGAQRSVTHALYFEAELALPFVPVFFWGYVSMYVLFFTPPFFLSSAQLTRLGKTVISATLLSGLIYILIPTQLGYARIVPADPFYAGLYAGMFDLDLPHNMVPSLHVVYSTIIILAILENMHTWYGKAFFWGWLILLCLSTLLVHQHHLLDVASGILVAVLIRKYYGIGESHV
ncbi:MAG: phosphatase PAP2 family protein [Gammaproteobacteria bacterium]|nr:phosphatase PAP2 family protein [Gammaproteobacteria bacterium]MDH5651956.1 phosphatase PAP2 family protein [Gammaproteobacteria bacterium]